jgi:hypothetical protein
MCIEEQGNILPHRDFKVHHLLRKGRHVVVKTKPVLPNTLGSKYEITLPLFGAINDGFVTWSNNSVVDIERAARLDLYLY